MKNNKNLTVIIAVLILLSVLSAGCSRIDYPPPPVSVTQTSEGEADGDAVPEVLENKYKLKKYDVVEKDFVWDFMPEEPFIISHGGGNSFTVDFEFNSSQHYRIGIEGFSLSGDAVVSLSQPATASTEKEVFGVYYLNPDESETSEGEESDEEESPEDGETEPEIGNEYFLEPIYFPEGNLRLNFTILRGSAKIDRVTATNTAVVPVGRYNNTVTLNCVSPSAESAALFSFLNTQYGSRVLSAQHCTVNTNAEIDAVRKATGRYPAVRFGEADAFLDDPAKELQLSEEWAKKGGLVGYTWIWRSPVRDGGCFADETEFSLNQALSGIDDTGVEVMGLDLIDSMAKSGEVSPSFLPLVRDIDAVGEVLKQLANKDIPVLFNPVPDGGSHLYWWSGDGAAAGEDYIRLWRFMAERLSGYHGLDNLIWIWSGGNYQYYPGDKSVDIIGESVFVNEAESVGSQAVRFGYTGYYSDNKWGAVFKKPAVVVSSSKLPSPDILARDSATWLMWGLYKGDFVIDEFGALLPNSEKTLDRFYNHEAVICLDELPALFT